MLGFSVYLNQAVTEERAQWMKTMKDAGFTGVFTSLHIPEDDVTQYLSRVTELGQICQRLGLQLTADVSAAGMQRMGIDISDTAQLTKLGITALRVDDGFSMANVAELSRKIPIALNASTISEVDVQELTKNQADFKHLSAWHNYYPRPETGLDETWLKTTNQWLENHGFTIVAFVAGDAELRGPLHAGLPTLESDRKQLPLAATLKLLELLSVDDVYIGDAGLSSDSCTQFKQFFQHDIMRLTVQTTSELLTQSLWHNRPDVARDVIRLEEGRRRIHQVTPSQMVKRSVGAITLDNDDYGRYVGELQIVKHELPANRCVNVIGQVMASDLALLSWIDSNQAVQFITRSDIQ